MKSSHRFLSLIVLGHLTGLHTASAEVHWHKVGGFPKPIECDPGQTLESFGLEGNGMQIEKSDIPFQGNYDLSTGLSIGKIRLEVCMDAQERTFLRRIVQQVPSPGWWTAFQYHEVLPDHIQADEKLRNAINGEPAGLHQEFKNSEKPEYSFLLKGHVTPDGRKFVTLSAFDSRTGNINEPSYPRVSAGILTYGDPFIPKFTHARRLIEVSGIRIETDFEYTGKPGLYMSYRFKRFVVEDSDPSSPLRYEGKGGEDSHLQIKNTHHSLNDEFAFVFEKAQYRLKPGKLEVTYGSAPARVIPLDCDAVHECGKDLLK